MLRRLALLPVGLALFLVGPAASAQEREKGESREERLEQLEKKLERLHREMARLRAMGRELRRELQRLAPRREEEEEEHARPERRWFRPFPFRLPPEVEEHLRELERHFRGLRRGLGWTQPFPGARVITRGARVSVRIGPEGHVRVEIREERDGKARVKVYEAESIKEFKEKYPEVLEKYGLELKRDGTFSFRFGGPRLWLGPFRDRLELPLRPLPGRDRLGVYVRELEEEQAEKLGLEEGEGLAVEEVLPESLAAKLGVREGDILLKINGRRIRGPATIRRALSRVPPGGKVTLEIHRPQEGKLILEGRKPRGRERIL